MFAVKAGALISNRPEMEHARRVVVRVYSSFGYQATVTSGEESHTTHKRTSKHYEGLAEDYRTRDVRPADLPTIVSSIQAILGRDYDAVLEPDHLHVEYDPKA